MLETFDLLPLAFFVADFDGRVLSADRKFAAMLGYSGALATGFSTDAITHPEDSPASRIVRRYVALTGHPLTYRKRYRRANGTVLWVENRLSLMETPAGQQLLVASVESVCPDTPGARAVDPERMPRAACVDYIADLAAQLGAMATAHNLSGAAELLTLAAGMVVAEAEWADVPDGRSH